MVICKRLFFCAFVFVFFSGGLHSVIIAQNSDSIGFYEYEYAEELKWYQKFYFRGLMLGNSGGVTGLGDRASNFNAAGFAQHHVAGNLFGEVSLGFRHVEGAVYKTRLIPLDYRFVYNLENYSRYVFQRKKLTPFVYGGGGLVFQKPISQGPGDSPLVVDSDDKVPASGYWGYNSGMIAHLPVGVGLNLRLEQSVSFVLNAGYNQTFSNQVAGTGRTMQGVWGISLGLRFGAPPPPPPVPVFRVPEIAEFPPYNPPVVLPKAKVDFSLEELEVNFDWGRPEIRPEAKATLDLMANIVMEKSDRGVSLGGHTDVTGGENINALLSYYRSWNVMLELLQRNVPIEKISLDGYGYERPRVDKSDAFFRQVNRRVEIRTTQGLQAPFELLSDRTLPIPQKGGVFKDNRVVYFWRSVGLSDKEREAVHALANTMTVHQDLKVALVSYTNDDGGGNVEEFIGRRRMWVIAYDLLRAGIDISRIEMYVQGFDEIPFEAPKHQEGYLSRKIEVIAR